MINFKLQLEIIWQHFIYFQIPLIIQVQYFITLHIFINIILLKILFFQNLLKAFNILMIIFFFLLLFISNPLKIYLLFFLFIHLLIKIFNFLNLLFPI